MRAPRRWHRPTGCTRLCRADGRPKQPPTRQSTRRDPSWCCCDRRTTQRRLTSTATTDRTTSVWGCWTVPSRSAFPKYGAALPAFRREQARRRCTMLLRCLGGVAVSTGLIGLLPWHAPGLGVHRALRPGGPGAGRADGVRQGARGRAGPPPLPARGLSTSAWSGTRRRRPAIREPGTTTTSRCRGPPPADAHDLREASDDARLFWARRGCSSAGRALRSQCRGRGFESHHLHRTESWNGRSQAIDRPLHRTPDAGGFLFGAIPLGTSGFSSELTLAKAPDTVRGRRVADFRRGQGGATGELGERARNVGVEGPQFCPRRTAVITPGTLLARHD